MNLTTKPEITNWPESHFFFVEKIGNFMDTAMPAWQELHKIVAELPANQKPQAFMALYKIEPEMIYRAGFTLNEKIANLPAGLSYEKFNGGKYSRFILVGPYSDLPEACGVVFEVAEKEIKKRDDWNIESYVTNPETTPPNDNITHILIPTA